MLVHLRNLVHDPQLRKTFGSAAYERALKHNNSNATFRAYLNLWSSLLAKGNRHFSMPQDFDSGISGRDFLRSLAPPLDAAMRLRTTDLGNKVFRNHQKMAPQPELKGILSGSIILKILDLAGNGTSIEILAQSILDVPDLADCGSLSSVLFHVGWCLNEGLLTSS